MERVAAIVALLEAAHGLLVKTLTKLDQRVEYEHKAFAAVDAALGKIREALFWLKAVLEEQSEKNEVAKIIESVLDKPTPASQTA